VEGEKHSKSNRWEGVKVGKWFTDIVSLNNLKLLSSSRNSLLLWNLKDHCYPCTAWYWDSSIPPTFSQLASFMIYCTKLTFYKLINTYPCNKYLLKCWENIHQIFQNMSCTWHIQHTTSSFILFWLILNAFQYSTWLGFNYNHVSTRNAIFRYLSAGTKICYHAYFLYTTYTMYYASNISGSKNNFTSREDMLHTICITTSLCSIKNLNWNSAVIFATSYTAMLCFDKLH
jgi:hypothetical protein